jgi:23S rRNA (uracil1939-C5)-methyltransferase
VEILEASPLRRSHPCPHADQCGGSRFGVLAPEASAQVKADILREASRRTLSQEALSGLRTIPSPQAWRYRWRGQIHVRSGVPHAKKHAGNELTPLTDCHLLSTPLAEAMQKLAAGLPDGRFTIAGSPATNEVFTEKDKGELVLPLPDFDLDLQIPPGMFFQANWELNQTLVRETVSALDEFDLIADLFSGAGNFALPLAARKKTVLAVDGAAASVRYGVQNARRQDLLSSVKFRSANLARPFSWEPIRSFAPQAAVLNPPRTGAKGVGAAVMSIPSLRRLIWISCDVVNTLRDARPLLQAGWQISDLVMLDMFPGTWHMEVLMVLDKPVR